MWFDRTGKALSQVGAERIFLDVVLSHDEKRALFDTTIPTRWHSAGNRGGWQGTKRSDVTASD